MRLFAFQINPKTRQKPTILNKCVSCHGDLLLLVDFQFRPKKGFPVLLTRGQQIVLNGVTCALRKQSQPNVKITPSCGPRCGTWRERRPSSDHDTLMVEQSKHLPNWDPIGPRHGSPFCSLGGLLRFLQSDRRFPRESERSDSSGSAPSPLILELLGWTIFIGI